MQVMCLSGETLGRCSQKAHEVKKVFDKKLLPHGMFIFVASKCGNLLHLLLNKDL